MNKSIFYQIDSGDLEDLFEKIEKSFEIEFRGSELSELSSFGQLIDHITNKLEQKHTDDCTSQQAFYKLREILIVILRISKDDIYLEAELRELFPSKHRRKMIKEVEKHMGFEIEILQPPSWVRMILSASTIVSIMVLIPFPLIGILGLLVSILLLFIANRLGNVLKVKRLSDLIHKITRENYLRVRRNAGTFNRMEIEAILIDLFSIDLNIERHLLTKEAKI